ncbi:MAG: segregation/condensation protein A [Candidatus Thorarchaeota archaeon]
MTESRSEPFWFHQPWRVLTDILELQKISPWELDLAELVNGFIGRLLTAEYIDFRICGRALLSAAILLRLKTEYLLEFGREEEEIIRAIEEEIFLPPIRPPFRKNVRPTSSAEFLEALRELVYPPKRASRFRNKSEITPLLIPQLDVSYVELTKAMKQLYSQLLDANNDGTPISFFEFVKGMSHIEIIRVFLSLLFLMSENKVSIDQEQEFGDIMISVYESPNEERIVGG